MGSLGRWVLAAVVACSIAAAADKKDADEENRKLLVKVCGGCHNLDIVANQRGSRDQWRATIEAMVAKGADASDDDFNAIIDYLAAHYGPDVPVDKLNVNTATSAQIAVFFGIADTQAAAIVKRRKSAGKFKSIE